ncbi:MAG: hypothetical protein Q9M28_10820 [Mariprofundaceae bacterium]|nr:hypothetical protein [Mariprofundaceae bacterium]
MVNHVCWSDIHMKPYVLRAAQVACEEYCFLHIPEAQQLAWLHQMFFPEQGSECVYLKLGTRSYSVTNPCFWQHIKMMMGCGSLMANLSLYDNLLLPSLYHGYDVSSEKVQEVIYMLDLKDSCYEQAGERHAEMHARITLGQCLLHPPKMIVIQDICTSLSVLKKDLFYELLQMTLDETGAGLCYVSSSESVSLPIHFPHYLMLEPTC